jgi:hypothetical protein
MWGCLGGGAGRCWCSGWRRGHLPQLPELTVCTDDIFFLFETRCFIEPAQTATPTFETLVKHLTQLLLHVYR